VPLQFFIMMKPVLFIWFLAAFDDDITLVVIDIVS
jgi:hypothetical protein